MEKGNKGSCEHTVVTRRQTLTTPTVGQKRGVRGLYTQRSPLAKLTNSEGELQHVD